MGKRGGEKKKRGGGLEVVREVQGVAARGHLLQAGPDVVAAEGAAQQGKQAHTMYSQGRTQQSHSSANRTKSKCEYYLKSEYENRRAKK